MTTGTPFLRPHGLADARVTNEELFFDLIYAFAVTQLSHRLAADIAWGNALETLVLWGAVWLGWQYTAWVTNWCNPELFSMRCMLFALMAVGLLVAAAIPQAFGARGLVFALGYAAFQVGRTLFVLWHLGRSNPLTPNFTRILGWLIISAILWIGGGLAGQPLRLPLWVAAVTCEYVAPMLGFRLPGLGRSRTTDWTIHGGHLAERCQLFVIMALGESVLVTGASASQNAHWDAPTLIALLVAVVTNISLWWIYFARSSGQGRQVLEQAADPGRLGAYFHYVHVALVAGIIVVAVANELVIEKPDARIDPPAIAVLAGGPLLYLFGSMLLKQTVYGRVPLSQVLGMVVLIMAVPLAFLTDRLMVAGAVALTLGGIAALEGRGGLYTVDQTVPT